jgi:hypothetical protein
MKFPATIFHAEFHIQFIYSFGALMPWALVFFTFHGLIPLQDF